MNPENFTFHALAEGVWAALAIPTGLAASNAGIVDLGDRTLVFDTTFSPAAAAELRAAAEQFTGRPVTAVLSSHWHSDHIFGNAVFAPEAEIYATARTAALMQAQTPAKIAEFKQHWPAQQKTWAEQARNATDEAERLDYEDGVRFAQAIINTLPQLALRLPTHTFTERVTFTGPQRTAEFITLGGGHTESDAFLHLPAERLIFTGDLLVVQNHPDLTDGHPRAWLAILAQIKALAPIHLIPGHGPLGTVAEVTAIEHYISTLLQLAQENALEAAAPAFTAGWNNAEAFEPNLRFLREIQLVQKAVS